MVYLRSADNKKGNHVNPVPGAVIAASQQVFYNEPHMSLFFQLISARQNGGH